MSRSPVSRVWQKTTRPGPAEYTLAGAMGKQSDSRHMSNLGKAFARESRDGFNLNPSLSDQFLFDHEVSLGKQLTSKRPTQPRSHFGTSNREHSVNMCAFARVLRARFPPPPPPPLRARDVLIPPFPLPPPTPFADTAHTYKIH